jgi:UDP-glucose 4-epimerase
MKEKTNMKTRIAVVVGGAGFIGCNLIAQLRELYQAVYCIDNLSRGSFSYLEHIVDMGITTVQCDASNVSDLMAAFEDISNQNSVIDVWHLAANSDISAGINDLKVDLKDTFQTTVAILEVMKSYDLKTLFFASSSAIYGDHGSTPLHENIGPLMPISNYGAMKLASEALISAAYETFLENAYIFRFPNVVGIPATHGVIFDFVNKLKSQSDSLVVLGNGTQRKAYLHVSDLVDAMLFIRKHDKFENAPALYNIGPVDDGILVAEIASIVANSFGDDIDIQFGSGNKGWVGDVPKFSYSTEKLQHLGWQPTLNSEQAIRRATSEIITQLR